MRIDEEGWVALEDCSYIRIFQHRGLKQVEVEINADNVAFLLSDYSDLMSSLLKDGYFLVVTTPESATSWTNVHYGIESVNLEKEIDRLEAEVNQYG